MTDSYVIESEKLLTQLLITNHQLPIKCRVEPEGPVAAVSVSRLFDDQFQGFRAGDVEIVAGFGGSANHSRAEYFLAVGLDDEDDASGIGLM